MMYRVRQHRFWVFLSCLLILLGGIFFWQSAAQAGWRAVDFGWVNGPRVAWAPDECFPTTDAEGQPVPAVWQCYYGWLNNTTRQTIWGSSVDHQLTIDDSDPRPKVVVGQWVIEDSMTLLIHTANLYFHHSDDTRGRLSAAELFASSSATVNALCADLVSGCTFQAQQNNVLPWSGVYFDDLTSGTFDRVNILGAVIGLTTYKSIDMEMRNSLIDGQGTGTIGAKIIANYHWVNGSHRTNNTRLINTVITNNTSHGVWLEGRGAFNSAQLTARITDSEISHNGGDGIRIIASNATDAVRPVIDGVSIHDNENGIYTEEGTYAYNTALMLIKNSRIENNRRLAMQIFPGVFLGSGSAANILNGNATAVSGSGNSRNVIRLLKLTGATPYVPPSAPSWYVTSYYPGYYSGGYRDPKAYEWYGQTTESPEALQAPVVVVGDTVSLAGGMSLKIYPSALLKINGGKSITANLAQLSLLGTLSATPIDPNTDGPGEVVLTSIMNTRAGSSTWAESALNSNPWAGISLTGQASGSGGTIIQRARIENAVVDVAINSAAAASTFTITQSVITAAQQDGIRVNSGLQGSSPAEVNLMLTSNVITANGGMGLSLTSSPGRIQGTISGNTISSNATNGLGLAATQSNSRLTPTISDNSIVSNTQAGVYVSESGYPLTVVGMAVVRNYIGGNRGMALQIPPVLSLGRTDNNTANTIIGNGPDGLAGPRTPDVIRVLGGTVSQSGAYQVDWGYNAAPQKLTFLVIGTVQFQGVGSTTNILNIGPNTIFQFYPNMKLGLQPMSQLLVNGSEGQEVVFTDLSDSSSWVNGTTSWAVLGTPQSGRWDGIISEHYVNLTMRSAVVRLADTGLTLQKNSSYTLDHVTSSDNVIDGLWLNRFNISGSDSSALTATVSNSAFANNGRYGILMDSSGRGSLIATLTNITASHNSNDGWHINPHDAAMQLMLNASPAGSVWNQFLENGGDGIDYTGRTGSETISLNNLKSLFNAGDGLRVNRSNTGNQLTIAGSNALYGNGGYQLDNVNTTPQYQITAKNIRWGSDGTDGYALDDYWRRGPFDSASSGAQPANTCLLDPGKRITDLNNQRIDYVSWLGLGNPPAPAVSKIDNRTFVSDITGVALNPTVLLAALDQTTEIVSTQTWQLFEFDVPSTVIWQAATDCQTQQLVVNAVSGTFFGQYAALGRLKENTHYRLQITFTNHLAASVANFPFFTGNGVVPSGQSWLQVGSGDIYSNEGVSLTVPPEATNAYNAAYCVAVPAGGTLEATFKQLPNDEFSRCQQADAAPLTRPAQNNGYSSAHFGLFDVNKIISQANVTGCTFTNQSMNLGGRIYYCNGNATIGNLVLTSQAGARGNGLIIVTGSLSVVGDVTYDDAAGVTDITQIPSLGVVALATESGGGDINIDPSVERLAGAYYADNVIDTCVPGLAPGAATCADAALTVQGLLTAYDLLFNRTSAEDPDTPAEKIVYDGRILANIPPGMSNLLKNLPWWSAQ